MMKLKISITDQEFMLILFLAQTTGLLWPTTDFDEQNWMGGLEAIIGRERLQAIMLSPSVEINVIY